MKKILFLLLASGACGVSFGQEKTVVGNSTSSNAAKSSCQAQINALNIKYNKQVTAFKTDSRLSPVDREFKILMTNFDRNEKLSEAEKACGASPLRYRSCMDAANAINQSFERQKEALRNNTNYTTAQESAKIAEANRARNAKLRDLMASCKY